MDPSVVNRVVQALDLVYASDTPADQRREAEELCTHLRNDASAPAYGFHLADAAQGYSSMVRHFGLQLIEHAIKRQPDTQACLAMRDPVFSLILQHPGLPMDAAYLREKLAALLVLLAVRAWPSAEWTDLSAQLMRLYGGESVEARDLALGVWRSLGEALFVHDRDPVATLRKPQLTNGVVGALLPKSVVAELYPSGFRMSSDQQSAAGKKAVVVLEPGNEEGWLLRWARYVGDMAREGGEAREAQMVSAIDTIAVFLEWVPIRALAPTQLVACLASALLVRSDVVRRRASEALETISRRHVAQGEDRDTVLNLMAGEESLRAIGQAYAATLPSADSSWDDSSEALVAARTLSQLAANLVTLHWARKKIEISALQDPARFVDLLVGIARDGRFSVAAPVLGSWSTILKHSAVSKVPQVAASFGALTEHSMQSLFRVCRALHQLKSGAEGVDPDEADEFGDDLRAFLACEVRGRLLGIVRGMCHTDPAGFAGWIMPSLAPALGPDAEPVATETALMTVDAVLAALDEFEQSALAESDAAQMAQAQSARVTCLGLGRMVVDYAPPPGLVGRQLATLPSLAFLLRADSVRAGGEPRDLLLAVLQKCASSLKGDQAVGVRATAALVRIAGGVPDALMLVYGDLSALVHGLLADPAISPTVKSYLREFQLALIAGATTCSLPERKALAQPVVQPMVQALRSLEGFLESPTSFIEFLGLPQVDQGIANGEEARERRSHLANTLSALYVCLNRTLGGSTGSLAAVWGDYIGDLARPLLLLIRCIHALWNPSHWQHLPWQSPQAHDHLFGITSEGYEEKPVGLAGEARDILNSLSVYRGHAYRCLGRLSSVPELFTISEVADNFAGCLFGDAAALSARHWRLLLSEVVRPVVSHAGGGFVGPWLVPLFAFCGERLSAEWEESSQRASVEEEIARDAVVRDWTRAWAQILSDLLGTLSVWIPDASQIEHDLVNSARIAAIDPQKAPPSSLLGAWLLRSPEVLAATLNAGLAVLRLGDSQAASRAATQLEGLVPALALVAMLALYVPPTPAAASTASAYTARLDSSMILSGNAGLLAWLSGDCVRALAGVLRDPRLVDVQDHVLLALANLVHAGLDRMPVTWASRHQSADSDPGRAFRQTVKNSLVSALGGGDVDLVENAFVQIVGEPEGKRRRALLRVAVQPVMAVEKSKMFGDSSGKGAVGAKRGRDAVWSNKLGAGNASLLDNDDLFDLMALALLCTTTRFAQAETPTEQHSCGPSSRYVVGYYQTWKRQSLMNIDWAKITHLNVAHAIPTDTGDFTFDGEWFLPSLVRDAHKQATKVALSIGGWTGSNRLSTIMRDTHKRATLIKAIGAFVEKHELDGVDIDWEYVGRQGSKCNKFSATEDAANFMRFLRALRAAFHARFPQDEKLVSLAVRVQPFDDAQGPMKDVSAFAEYVDFASILAFDINGPWANTTGPNAPFEHQRSRGAPYSFTQAVDQWLDAKWPASKLVAGVSFHGRSLTTRSVVTAKEGADMYVAFDKDVPQGDAEDALWYDVCENVNSMSGVWQYKHLRDQGILKTANTTGDEWVRVWDNKSSTPWLYNPPMRRFISYDDQQSIDKKVDYARKKGLKGMMAWSLHSDYNAELISALDNIGPLCRGPKSDSDQLANTTTAATTLSSTSVWSPTPPFANLPTLSSSTHSSASPSSSASLSDNSSVSPSPSSSESSSLASSSSATESAAVSTSLSLGKMITFNDVGAPILVVNGVSTAVPSDLAEKLMKIVESPTSSSANATDTASPASSQTTATDGNTSAAALTSRSDDAPPLGPIAIPVVDSAEKSRVSPPPFTLGHGPSRPAWNIATNLFDSPITTSKSTAGLIHDIFLGMASSTPADPLSPAPVTASAASDSGGFATTFYLSLDTNSQSSGVQTTTVIPLSLLMASAKSEAAMASLTSASPVSADPLSSMASSSTGLLSSASSTLALSTTDSSASVVPSASSTSAQSSTDLPASDLGSISL
ncbi:hypothetical protein GGI20_004858 [Coemansia sp. BCRC 34301]|nr:hypothetical protein GGI20_004858 [Coemansia sp. BCRC 34301]